MDGLTPRMKAAVANIETDPEELIEVLANRARAAIFHGGVAELMEFMFQAIKEGRQFTAHGDGVVLPVREQTV